MYLNHIDTCVFRHRDSECTSFTSYDWSSLSASEYIFLISPFFSVFIFRFCGASRFHSSTNWIWKTRWDGVYLEFRTDFLLMSVQWFSQIWSLFSKLSRSSEPSDDLWKIFFDLWRFWAPRLSGLVPWHKKSFPDDWLCRTIIDKRTAHVTLVDRRWWKEIVRRTDLLVSRTWDISNIDL